MDYLDQTLINRNIATDTDQAMSVEEATKHIEQVDNWELVHDDATGYHLKRHLKFGNADQARRYIADLKTLADDMHTIPTIQLKGTEVEVICYTPQLKGVHINDFIMAATTNDLFDRWDLISDDRDKVTEASDESFPASDPPGY